MRHNLAAMAFMLGTVTLVVPAWAQDSAESVTVIQESVTVIQQPDGSLTMLNQEERRVRFKTAPKPILPPDRPTRVARFLRITLGDAITSQVTKLTGSALKPSGGTVHHIQKPQAGEIKPTAVAKPEIPMKPEVPRLEIPKVEPPKPPTPGASLAPSGTLQQTIRTLRPPEKPVTPMRK